MKKAVKVPVVLKPVVPSKPSHPPPISHIRAKLSTTADQQKKNKKKRASNATPDVLANALRAEFKPRRHAAPSVKKAKFFQAQQRIRKDLGIQNRIDGATYIALGRVLDGVAKRVIERTGRYLNHNTRYGDNHQQQSDDGASKLTERKAITAIRSFFPAGRDAVWDQIHGNMHNALQSYHRAAAAAEAEGEKRTEPASNNNASEEY